MTTKDNKEIEKSEVEEYIEMIRDRNRKKLNLRETNLNADENRPDEVFLRKLDSSLKKNTAFVRRLKLLTDGQRESLTKDFTILNLSKYIEELASSLVEAKLKMADVSCAVEICSLAHQRYSGFATSLLDAWRKVLPLRKNDTISSLSKLRVDLRFFSELVSVGVFTSKEGTDVIDSVLLFLTNQQHIILITAFCRHCGHDWANLTPHSIRLASDNFGLTLPQSSIFSAERQSTVLAILNKYFDNVCDHVLTKMTELTRLKRRNRHQYAMKGEVHPEARKQSEDLKIEVEKLIANVKQLAEYLDREEPLVNVDDLKDDDEDKNGDQSGLIILADTTFRDGHLEGNSLWEDEETRLFYESLPELRIMLPGILYKESEEATLMPLMEKISEECEIEIDEEREKAIESAEDEEDEEQSAPTTTTTKSHYQRLNEFLDRLSTLVNRDLVDSASVDFVTHFNTRHGRNRLLSTLRHVHRNRLDLLPFYARLTATLQPVMPDLGTQLVQFLIGEFRKHLRIKKQLHIESKLRCLHFIGELTKFGVCPKSEALHCLHQLLFDFRHHNIDMACALLDTAGLFLFRSADSYQKTRLLLETMQRKRQQATGLDQRYQLMIENALLMCDPPASTGVKRVQRPPLHDYIRMLLYIDLCKSTCELVLKQMRKLDWTDMQIDSYGLHCLSCPWMVKFDTIQYLASVVAGLMWYHDSIGYRVVDGIIEELRIGMEVNHPRLNQRRIACARFLGEMYNYRVCDSSIIFKTLYSLITFGVTIDPYLVSLLDPPEHLFRIRIVCQLLDTCAEYFNSGLSRRKLDCFLVYFQRYCWFKRSLSFWTVDPFRPYPREAINLVDDVLEKLRPKLTPFVTLNEAEQGVQELQEEYKEKVESALKFVTVDDAVGVDDEEFAEERLRAIAEEEEGDDGQSQPCLSDVMEGIREEEEEEEEDEGNDDTDDDDDDEEQNIRVHKETVKNEPEDDQFRADLDRLLADSTQIRTVESVHGYDLMVPSDVKLKLYRKTKFGDYISLQKLISKIVLIFTTYLPFLKPIYMWTNN